jgi:hypothetical protein
MKKLICFTGAPCSGKTQSLNSMALIKGYEDVHIIPEAPTFFRAGLHDIPQEGPEQEQFDKVVYHSRLLSSMEALRRPEDIVLFDRGTFDGMVYHDDFFNLVNSTPEIELNRYTAIVLFETLAAVDKYEINGPRWESPKLALDIHAKLRDICRKHSNFIEIPANLDSMRRLSMALDFIDNI